MKAFKKLHLLLNPNFLLFLTIYLAISSSTTHAQHEDANQITKICGKHRIQAPFLDQNHSSNLSSPLNHLILCKSQKLYFRTSLGLFPISFVNYTTKTLIISHYSSCSSSVNYVSPSLLSAGFPSPPQPNSLFLFNCSSSSTKHDHHHQFSPFIRNHTCLNECGGASSSSSTSSCLVVEDILKMDMGFHPRDFKCTHYSPVYKKYSDDDVGYELGTRVSFDIPDHAPDICTKCQKPNGNCGVGLKCICHLQECSK